MYDFSCCCPDYPCVLLVKTRLRTFAARLLPSQEGLFPHALPCMQRFRAFFTPLLWFPSSLKYTTKWSTTRKEAQGARQTGLLRPMAGWLTSMLRATGPSTKISGNEEMTECKWPLSTTILQLPQDKTEGAQSALIEWQFTCCKYLRILGRAFHKASPTDPQQKLKETNRIVSAFFRFDAEFVEERSLHLFCFGWLPLI